MVNLDGQLEGFKQAPTLGKELTPQPVTTLRPPLHQAPHTYISASRSREKHSSWFCPRPHGSLHTKLCLYIACIPSYFHIRELYIVQKENLHAFTLRENPEYFQKLTALLVQAKTHTHNPPCASHKHTASSHTGQQESNRQCTRRPTVCKCLESYPCGTSIHTTYTGPNDTTPVPDLPLGPPSRNSPVCVPGAGSPECWNSSPQLQKTLQSLVISDN